MRNGQVKIINNLGLHARAAAKLIKIAENFESDIKLSTLDKTIFADAKSILNILTLAASKGTILNLQIEGIDEDSAFDAITEIFENGFGEL